jgi:eukaryotic-like serine/threonine-protein kinase
MSTTIRPGVRIGHYEIRAALGRGGMGEVWRARDTTLHRDVAIKTLPDALARDADRLARLTREARLLASLNHPNIAAIYGLDEYQGTRFLVLELVEGSTLEDRLRGGAIPVRQALAFAVQVAEALEAAHERGVVHRDLKPANISVTPDGRVKVLDFGLAKGAAEPASPDRPTLTAVATAAGRVMGTPAYMSPEQVRGEAADAQSDIWSFGAVLYELLTGVSPFARNTAADTMAAVLDAPPDFSALPARTPSAVQRVVRRCLDKDRRRRARHMGDVRLDLEDALHAQPVETPTRPSRLAWVRRSWAAAAIVLLVVAIVLAALLRPRAVPADPAGVSHPERSSILIPGLSVSFRLGTGLVPLQVALSPNGERLAFLAPDSSGTLLVWVKPMDAFTVQPLAGTEGAETLFWSDDSQSIAFVADRRLKRIAAAGGDPQILADVTGPPSAGAMPGAWHGDVILFTASGDSPIVRVSARGVGGVSEVTTVDRTTEVGHGFPVFLPGSGGQRFLYLAAARDGGATALYAGSLDSDLRVPLMEDVLNVRFASGALLYVRMSGNDARLLARRFDPESLTFTDDEEVLLAGGIDVLTSPELHEGRHLLGVLDRVSRVSRRIGVAFDARVVRPRRRRSAIGSRRATTLATYSCGPVRVPCR